MLGVDSRVVWHKQDIDQSVKPIRQTLRRVEPEQMGKVKEKIDRLSSDGFITRA